MERARVGPDMPSRRWLARLGVVGFTFFLIKGLLWLIVPGLLAIGLIR